MRPLIYQSLVTLDGYVGGPNGELDWHLITPEMHEVYNEAQRQIGGYIMGRKTYEVMRGWDELGGKPDDKPEIRGFHRDWLDRPKLVFSRTPREVGYNASLATGDAIAAVRALKAGTGKPIALNGTALADSLMPSGLIDEYLLFVHPVLLGAGTRLFPAGAPRVRLRLLDSQTYPAGVTRLHYAVAR
jgi:dihydrofolate reductase